jgi:hypothetical protein
MFIVQKKKAISRRGDIDDDLATYCYNMKVLVYAITALQVQITPVPTNKMTISMTTYKFADRSPICYQIFAPITAVISNAFDCTPGMKITAPCRHCVPFAWQSLHGVWSDTISTKVTLICSDLF